VRATGGGKAYLGSTPILLLSFWIWQNYNDINFPKTLKSLLKPLTGQSAEEY